MAAISSAGADACTAVVEANTTAGRKLLLTGGGRCNFTNLVSVDEMVRAFGAKGRFLSYSLYEFPPDKVRDFFRGRGLQSNVEQDGCVFPVTDRPATARHSAETSAGEVRDVLLAEAKRLGVHFLFSMRVQSVTKHGRHFTVRSAGQEILAEKVIIATGGVTWPSTGSTGDGYRFAQELGHVVIRPRPSLVPLVTSQSWPSDLAGTSLENVKISAPISVFDRRHGGKKKITVTGSMIFTHDGVGGPAVLDLSRLVADFLPSAEKPIELVIDLSPGTTEAELEKQILERFGANPKKTVANILAGLVPRRVSAVLCRQFHCAELLAGQISKDMRRKLVRAFKALPLSVTSTRPIDEAMVTHGGVDVTQVEAKTMESKICPHLFFAGEVLDVDGPCGGYNLQICWSTGALAGSSAARR